MAEKASFSVRTKDELCRIYPEKECCRLAELAALVRLDGTVTIGLGGKTGLYVATEYSAAARKVYRLLKDCFGVEGELTVKRQNRLKKHTLYHIRIPAGEETRQILNRLGILEEGWSIRPDIPRELVRRQCCRKSYLRGAFLGGGSVSSPESSYHLEILASHETQAQSLAALINRFPGMQAKISSRKQAFIVYLKDSEQIAEFLALIGAHASLLEFENARVLRGVKNQVNRLVNCETANLSKTVEAALRQVEVIQYLQKEIGLESLEPPLEEVARLRLANREVNLKELGQLLSPPVGKSGVNHRMRRLEEIARELHRRPKPGDK